VSDSITHTPDAFFVFQEQELSNGTLTALSLLEFLGEDIRGLNLWMRNKEFRGPRQEHFSNFTFDVRTPPFLIPESVKDAKCCRSNLEGEPRSPTRFDFDKWSCGPGGIVLLQPLCLAVPVVLLVFQTCSSELSAYFIFSILFIYFARPDTYAGEGTKRADVFREPGRTPFRCAIPMKVTVMDCSSWSLV
jgi:hypothetical protein